MNLGRSSAARVALLAASSLSVLANASPALAKAGDYRIADSDRLNASEALRSMVTNAAKRAPDLRIVTNDGPFITPAPGKDPIAVRYANSKDVLDTSGINGVGQMIALEFPFLGLCTGTLINPRTVITAAHCVFDNPAHMYGSVTGTGGGVPPGQGLPTSTGIPISFGFEPTNRCRGVQVNGCAIGTGPYETWRDSGYQTQVAKHIYNGNQVWYHPDSGKEFGLADIALVTLDTHVQDIPTWTLLFSPLTGSTHVTITGYGAAGVGTTGIGDAAGIDYRRRSAENMIDALMSSDDWAQSPAQGSYQGFSSEAHSLYWFDFDDPAYDPTNPTKPADTAWGDDPANPLPAALADPVSYNWNTNGLGGGALKREGTTAGGDSGGPLIVDTTFSKPVVAGVLTGGWSYNGGIGTYGEFSVYPPLFLYWQDIVANNPYKYVSSKGGDADWFDPTHWIQDMDPNYAVIGANGELVTGLPNVAQLNPDSRAGRWGTNCFFETLCTDVNGTAYPTGTGSYVFTAGGPGSTNFVPNNVEPVNSSMPSRQVQARYYDVTLAAVGTTTLKQAATIDKLTLNGGTFTRLNITSAGSLNVWGDFNQLGGWTHVDGMLKTSEALIGSGILSGNGTFDPTYLTVVAGAVGPGGTGAAGIGTLTVRGNVIMASASGLLIDMAGTNLSDKLQVLADSNVGQLALNGGSLVLSQLLGGAAIRDKGSYVIATAQGGVSGKFGTVSLANGGNLAPTVAYSGNQITVTLKAGKLATMAAGTSATTLAFASALDALRANSYNSLWGLYGGVDLMNADQLETTFSRLSPASLVGETRIMQDRQSRQLLGNVSDRLSLLGTGRASGMTISGNAAALSPYRSDLSVGAQLGLSSGGSSVAIPATEGLSGFVAMSSDHVASSYGDQRGLDAGQFNRYFATGVEAPVGEVMVGTAFGYAESISRAGSDEAKSKMAQAAAYASVPVGKHAYVGGILAAERSSTDVNRLATDTMSAFSLTGGTHAARYSANVEAGFTMGLAKGLSFTPRAQVGVSHYSLGGFRESGGETALDLDSLKVNRIETRLGAKLDGATKLGAWTLRPQVQADYVRLVSGRNNGLTVAFAAAPEYSFALPLTNGGSGWMEAKGGVELTKGAFSFGLSGQATVGDAPLTDQRGMAELKFSF